MNSPIPPIEAIESALGTLWPIVGQGNWRVNKAIQILQKAMGDASTRKDEGAATGVTPPDMCAANSPAKDTLTPLPEQFASEYAEPGLTGAEGGGAPQPFLGSIKSSEIPVVDDAISNALECANLFVLKNCHLPKSVEVIQAINAGRDALRLHKPVMVKLERCASAIHASFMDELEAEYSEEWEDVFDKDYFRKKAKAVLTAAGVKYHE